MSFKKLLGIISVVIVVVFSMMLATSYAWYSFENASTIFNIVTNNDDIIVSYQTGEYISTDKAVPISSADVDKYSDKNNFTVNVKDNKKDNEMVVTIYLDDIVIDDALKSYDFKVELYHQSSKISTIVGSSFGTATTKKLGTVTLIDDVPNNFEVRVYLLDNGGNQTAMMNKSFQAKIKVDVVSRLKTSFQYYTNSDIYVSAITIDGVTSKSLPTEGYHDMTATCTKGSILTWDPISKTITYNSGSYVKDNCSLAFTTNANPNYPLLSEMPVGSYVKYTGNNGCKGKSCSGQNANYVSDTDMGYCGRDDQNKFYANGWRIGYVENGSAFLVSAGAVECVCTNSAGTFSNSVCTSSLDSNSLYKHIDNMNEASLKYCNNDYVYGGVCNLSSTWAMNATDFEKILDSVTSISTCYNSRGNLACGYNNDLIDNGGHYWLATVYNELAATHYIWNADYRSIFYDGYDGFSSKDFNGLRVVLRLDTSVGVIGGTGTYEDPYLIEKNN